VLKLENVSTHYGEVQALQKVSFRVIEGQIVSIIGSNGAGKTTTLNTISGVLRCSSGTIQFLERRIEHIPPYQIVELGLVQVPEGRLLFPYMTVSENLELGAFAHKARKEFKASCEMVFELFPILEQRKYQLAGTLSGGEQQMLAIGRGLMAKPKLLMLDEPSIGLAPLIVEQVFQTIKEINQRGISILLVEQNVFQSLVIAHRACVLENGVIILEGEGKEVLKDPQVKEAYMGI
jgi:branched-chain amino acid transport system ATP-binding protein